MTNTKRLLQKLNEEKQPLYALEKYNEYGVIQAYADETEIDYPTLAQEWLDEFELLGIYIKRRFKTKKNHTDVIAGDKAPEVYIVEENKLKFEIRFEEHMDVGLFLDHRISREIVASESHGKDVLNLFAYTGSFSVYATNAGAHSTTTVDLSQNYIEWAKNNFELNKIPPETPHEFWAMDTLEFIEMARDTETTYDIIVVDPPSFSRNNSDTFQVQRDHKEMIRTLQNNLLNTGGFIFFSTNLQTFKLDDYLRPGADKYTKKTVPEEFKPFRPHQSYVFYN